MPQNPLANTSWRLIGFITGDSETPPIEGTKLTANFTTVSISGSGGCNQFAANYLIKEPEQISISDLAHTKIFCPDPPGTMEQESEYFQRLLGATHFELAGSGPLILISRETELGLKFERSEWVSL